MNFEIVVNLPYSHLGLLFLFYYLLAYTSIPKYIKRGALIYHRHTENRINLIINGKILHEDIYAFDDDEVKAVKDVEEKKEDVEEVKDAEKVKEPINFEDKYLSAFKHFSNDYFFTEEELVLKAEKYAELKAEYEANKAKTYDNMHNLLIETQKILNTSSTITEEVKTALVKYFEIEDDYNDDPSNIDFDELYIYVENDSQKFLLELETLEKNNWSHELETEIQEKALQHILELKLDGFINNYILEFTPLGNVYMRYNNQKKSFEYYSNNSIPYRYLEVIGRKYVMTFRCKSLFVDLEEELKIASEKQALEKDKNDLDKALEKNQRQSLPGLVQKPTIQKFKSYNKDLKMDKNMMSSGRPGQNSMPLQIKANLPNVNGSNGEKQLLKENANRYTWIDRLTNLQLLKKVDRKTIDKQYALSFADFKKMKEIKK
jgi:hypothetical protein